MRKQASKAPLYRIHIRCEQTGDRIVGPFYHTVGETAENLGVSAIDYSPETVMLPSRQTMERWERSGPLTVEELAAIHDQQPGQSAWVESVEDDD